MALWIGPMKTGDKGLIQQSLTQPQAAAQMELADALRRKNMPRKESELFKHDEAKADIARLSKSLAGMKDQSRVGGLPPGPMPPPGDVTQIEKGAGPQPISVPIGIKHGQETPFKAVPPDRFSEPTQMASTQQIQDAFNRRQAATAVAQNGAPNPLEMAQKPPTPTPMPEPRLAQASPTQTPSPRPTIETASAPAPAPAPMPARVAEPTFAAGAKLPAGMRNNNPGNLKYSGSAWQRRNFPGMLGPSTTHGAGNTDQGDPQIAFRSHMDGMKAAVNLAMSKYRGGKHTVYSLIAGNGGWTPGYTPAANNIARSMGVGVNDPINLNDPNTMLRFMRGLLAQEHGNAASAYSDDFILAAINGGEAAEPTVNEDWVSGGETMTASAPQAAAPTPAMAYSAENSPMMQQQGSPQDALIRALMMQQGSASGYAPAQGGGNWAPMTPTPRTETAQSTPIVSGGNVNPVSFGSGGGVASEEQIDNRKQLAAAMMARGSGIQNIEHPTQGLAQVANAAAGAYGMNRANQQEMQRRQALAQALMGARGGGPTDAIYGISPEMGYKIDAAREAQAAAQQQAQRERREGLEDYETKAGIDAKYRDPPRPPNDVQEYQFAVQQMRERGVPEDQVPSYTDWGRENSKAGATAIHLNEGEQKTAIYYPRMLTSYQTLEGLDEELLKLDEGIAGNVPIAGNYYQSENYQRARRAQAEFLAAILRKDSGAVITEDEIQQYTPTFFPVPGDKPGTIRDKRLARFGALKALRESLGPKAEALAPLPDLPGEGGPQAGGQPAPQQQQYSEGQRARMPDGSIIVFRGGSWVPE